MSSLVTVLRACEGLLGALAAVHRGNARLGGGGADTIKRKVGNTYGVAAGFMSDTQLCWNWGMHRDDVHEELRTRFAGYDGAGESDGYSEQLYFYAFRAAQQDVRRPRRILEVGCGTGKGLNLLAGLEEGSSFVGLDLSQEAISVANARFARTESVQYLQGDAEALPFSDGEFDVVVNVESSHNYPNPDRFFAEAVRVLKPGGYLVHADLVTPAFDAALSRIRNEMSGTVEWLLEEDISDLVRAAIRKRMEPNSYFRREVRRNFALPSRLLLEPLMMNSYGYIFIREHCGVISTLMRTRFRKVLPIETYRLTLARRTQTQARQLESIRST